MKPVKPEQYRFRKSSGIVLYKEFIDFARYMSKKLGFQVSADGMDIQETPEGVHIRGGMGSVAAPACPFSGELLSTESGMSFQFTSPGGLNGAGLPSNMFSGGALNSFTVSNGQFIKLKAFTDGMHVTSTQIVVDSSPADPIGVEESAGPVTFEIDLWAISNNKAFRIAACENLSAALQLALTTSSETPECGQDPYIRHYTFVVQ